MKQDTCSCQMKLKNRSFLKQLLTEEKGKEKEEEDQIKHIQQEVH